MAALPPELRTTAAAGIVRDQTSAGHPVGALLVPPVLAAAGIPHATPRVFVLPKDHPRLGQFAAEYGGMLGTIEERPDDEEGAAFEGAEEVISTAKLLKEVEDSPNDRVDARRFLTARLVDVFIGDWDRHVDQWRWARFEDSKPHQWVPIPRDRDQAFALYDGLLLKVARASTPQLVKFGPEYAGLLGQNWNGRDLDRRLPGVAGARGLGLDRDRPPVAAHRLGDRGGGGEAPGELPPDRFHAPGDTPSRRGGTTFPKRRQVLPPPRRRGGRPWHRPR